MYLHWTGGDYEETFAAYHYCIALRDGVPVAIETHDPAANARDVRACDGAYAAHVADRNSHALGVAVCGMRDATPQDFGTFALRDDMLEAACALVARLCGAHGIPIDAAHVRTHAEAALDDGYFGSGQQERWDIARVRPGPGPLDSREARDTAEYLRERVRAYAAGTRGGGVLWGTLGIAIAAWALFLWHPWIDWFGR